MDDTIAAVSRLMVDHAVGSVIVVDAESLPWGSRSSSPGVAAGPLLLTRLASIWQSSNEPHGGQG